MSFSPNKITGAKAGGLPPSAIRSRWAARFDQFRPWGSHMTNRIVKAPIAVTLGLVMAGCTYTNPNKLSLPRELPIAERQEQDLRVKYLGKDRQELHAVFGAAVTGQVENDTWEIWDRLGPGAHSFVWVTQITFKNDVAVVIKRHQKAVGCILVEPRREK